MNHRQTERGQAGLEFVIVVPVLMLALLLLGYTGNLLYQKLSAQSFTYTHCIWETTGVRVHYKGGSAFTTARDQTKKTWNTEGLWESYPTQKWGDIQFFGHEDTFTKKCVGSVTHDEWNVVGYGLSEEYNPDLLVESKLSISRTDLQNHDLNPFSTTRFGLHDLLLIFP